MGFFKPNIEKMLNRQDVEGLIKALKHKDFEVRKRAADALSKIGDAKAVESLIGALRDEYLGVRMEAAKVLGKIGDAGTVEPLITAMADKNTDVRKTSEKALVDIAGRIGPAAKAVIPALRAALGDNNPKVREASARALDKIGVDEEATRAALMERLKDSNAKVRNAAAVAIGGELGNIYPDVERLHTDCRWDAVPRLVKIGKAAVPALVVTLNYQGRNSSSVRGGAAEALGKIGDARAVEPLIQALKDKDDDVRRNAAEALGKIGDVRATEETIDWLVRSVDLELQNQEELKSWTETMSNLFGDYTAFILRASRYIDTKYTETSSPGARYESGSYKYNLYQVKKAVRELCAIHSQISNNILRKVADRKDIKVIFSWSCDYPGYDTLSFETQRQMAKKELERRSNPPYDPRAYLDKEAWKL